MKCYALTDAVRSGEKSRKNCKKGCNFLTIRLFGAIVQKPSLAIVGANFQRLQSETCVLNGLARRNIIKCAANTSPFSLAPFSKMTTKLKINEELQNLLPPLSDEELAGPHCL
ncbi:MAG: hypothetical protein ACRCUY_06985 [Thermoguttaceae bacterium]